MTQTVGGQKSAHNWLEPKIKLEDNDLLGVALRVDTTAVWGLAADDSALTAVGVGSLIAIEGPTPSEFLIGTLDRVTRDVIDSYDESDEVGEAYEPAGMTGQRDLFRVSLLGTYRTIEGSTRDTFKRGADSFPRLDARCWLLSGSNLQALLSLTASSVPSEHRLTLGTFLADKSAVAVADGDRLFQRHVALVGSTGSGKSWCVALLLERASSLPHANLIVLDIHSEYGSLTAGDDAAAVGYRIAGPGASESPASPIYLPYWLLNQEELLALVLDRSEDNAPNQAARFTHHVRELKGATLAGLDGKADVLESYTVDSPIPFSMDDLITRLVADDTEMVEGAASRLIAGPFKGKLTRFISRLRARVSDRRYSFMFRPELHTQSYDWLHEFAKSMLQTAPGIKVIDFSEVPSDALPVVTGVFARFLYDVQFWMSPEARTPVTIVCDEAHAYLPAEMGSVREQRALDAFERIAKEGRKYGVSLFVVSQRPSDVSRTILSQCNNFIVLRLTNSQDQNVVARLLPDNVTNFVSILPLMDVGECVVVGDAILLPTRIKLDKPHVAPISATRPFWSEWAEKASSAEAIGNAVAAMRKQSRV